MALVDTGSCECINSQLEIFETLPTQTSIESNHWQKYYPVCTLDTRGGPIEFQITPGDHDYMNLSCHYLYTKNRILDESGNKIETDEIVFPINYFHATRFKNIEILINNKSVTSSDNLYSYRAYLEALLNYDKQATIEQLGLGLYSKDTNNFDENGAPLATENIPDGTNKGAYVRYQRTKKSNVFECIGRLHCEIFNQPKLILNDCSFTVRLHLNDQKFYLMSGSDKRYTVVIDSAILFINHTKVSDSVREAHELALMKANAKYPVRQIQMKYFTRSAGRTDLSEQNLVTGTLPRKLIFGLVETGAFTGQLSKNPFNFFHFNVEAVVLRVNSQTVPYENFNLDFEKNLFCQGYISLLHGTHRLYRDKGMYLTADEYSNGNTLYAFDLTPDQSNSHFNLIREGTISLEIKLKKAHEESITIITYLEFDNVIEISKDRNVFYE